MCWGSQGAIMVPLCSSFRWAKKCGGSLPRPSTPGRTCGGSGGSQSLHFGRGMRDAILWEACREKHVSWWFRRSSTSYLLKGPSRKLEKDSAQKLNIAFLKNDGWKLEDVPFFSLGGGQIFRGKMLNFWMYYRIYPEKHVRKGRISTVSVIRVIRFPRFVHWLTEKQQWAERSSLVESICWRRSLKPVVFFEENARKFRSTRVLGDEEVVW